MLRITLLSKPLSALAREDVEAFLRESPPENLFLELKQDLPERDGGPSQWSRGEERIADKSKQDLAAEVVAFANGDGGTLLVGVRETSTEPKRPAGLNPLPKPAELARRLRQAIADLVEPPLTAFEAGGVVTEDDGGGIVVLRIEPSLLAPHRLKFGEWQSYVRREDEKRKMTMREIQDMVLERDRAATRFERSFLEAERRFRAGELLPEGGAVSHFRWQMTTAPRRPVRVMVTDTAMMPGTDDTYVARDGKRRRFHPGLPYGYEGQRPILGGIASDTSTCFGEAGSYGRRIREERFRDGRYVVSVDLTTPRDAELATEELGGWLLRALNWIGLVRHAAAEPGLAFGLQFMTDNRRGFLLRPLGADGMYSSRRGRSNIERAISVSPVYEVGTDDAMESVANDVFVDLASSFGAPTWDWRIPRGSYGVDASQLRGL